MPDGSHFEPPTALRLRLLTNGWNPVPVAGPNMQVKSRGKRPLMDDWPNVCAAANEAEVRRWATAERQCTNTGILSGINGLIAVDIDVVDETLAARILGIARAMLGPTPFIRIGKAPKTLLLYRLAEPQPKAETPEMCKPASGDAPVVVAQVEVLGVGQQFVAYGIHPDTGRPYEWAESAPDGHCPSDVPETTSEAVRAFLGAAEGILRAAGYVTVNEAKSAANGDPEAAHDNSRRHDAHGAGRKSRTFGIDTGDGFFREANARAVAGADAWVKAIFPTAYWQPNATTPPGAWRIASKDLGRGLEEDIAIHVREGCQDFGTRESLTPIDLVMRHGGAPDALAAALWLCEKLSIDAATLGWRGSGRNHSTGQAEGDAEERTAAGEAHSKPEAKTGDWPDPLDFLGDDDMTGAPELRRDHLPEALAGFVFDAAARLGVDPAAVALCAVVACASVANDEWAIQPKVHDDTWTENPRLWGAVVGDPSMLKSPVLRACTSPVDALDAEARRQHAEVMERWRAEVAKLKTAKVPPEGWPRQPRLDRYLVEGTTMDALTEVLRDDADAKQRAPAGKVLIRQDELSEWLASFDAYRAGSKGGGDRGAYLRLFNGGRATIDRVGRGNFAIPNWSGCVLGGIQPEPIQRIAKEAADDGLLQRFLFVVPATQADGEDRRPDDAALARYRALFPALAALRPPRSFEGEGTTAVKLSAEAQRHRQDIEALRKAYAGMPDTSARLKAALGKWPGIFARIALTFYAIEIADAHARGEQGPVQTVLSGDTAGRAAGLLRDVLLPHLLRADALLFLTRQTGHARWIAGYMLASEDARRSGRVTLRDVQRAYKPLRAPEHRRELTDTLQSLEVMGWLRAEIPDNAARPTTTWHVNPKLHVTFADRAAAERARRDAAKDEIAAAIHAARGRAA